MPRYGRDFTFRDDEDNYGERGPRGREFPDRFGAYGGSQRGGFNEDAVDEMGFSAGFEGDYDADFRRGGYGGTAPGGSRTGGWNRGYEARDERDLGGYERGSEWGRGPGRGMGGLSRGFGGGRGGFDEPRGAWGGGDRGWGRGGSGGDELRRLRAADIMTDNPECVTPEASLADAARKMRELDVGIIPVVESESSRRLRGVITDRDIAIRAVADGRDANSTRVSEVMTTHVESCNKNDPVHNILRLMEREQVRRVPITDREGRLVGIVAQADVATELDDHRSEIRVADTLERISEPRSGRGGMRAGQGRGGPSASEPMRGRSSMGRGGPEGSGEPRGTADQASDELR